MRTLKDDKIVFDKGEELPYQSEDVFNIAVRQFKNKLPLKRKPCLIHVKGKVGFTHYAELGEELEGITNKDRSEFVKRQIARALSKVKPMSTMQFVIMGALLVAILIINILSATGRI